MLFAIAFLFQWPIAGLTGIILSVAPFDWQVHFTYFLIAHFHYVLVGAILFMIFSAVYYWFPKATGRMLDERLGRWHFWLMVVGFHLTFDVMFIPGLLGMPRQIYTYMPDRPWAIWNQIVSAGAFIQGIGTAIFLYNVVHSFFRGPIAGPDPWDAWTLEWSTSSPPPAYNFAAEPVVASRRPLWDLKHPEDPDSEYEAFQEVP
jgi:cytochrome c oxidase subunit 1